MKTSDNLHTARRHTERWLATSLSRILEGFVVASVLKPDYYVVNLICPQTGETQKQTSRHGKGSRHYEVSFITTAWEPRCFAGSNSSSACVDRRSRRTARQLNADHRAAKCSLLEKLNFEKEQQKRGSQKGLVLTLSPPVHEHSVAHTLTWTLSSVTSISAV